MSPLLVALLSALTPGALWEAWPAHRFVPTPAPCLRHAELVERLVALEAKHRGRLRLEEAGRSAEGRAITLMTVGEGPRRVLLWSQMHGDEPSATPALLDLADFLLARREEPEVRRLLDSLTLFMIPMLNPDGTERYQRRNAQEIDVNRDALAVATPEGRVLKDARDRLRPELGFNLHDMNRRTTVGATGVLATIALLAVAGDPAGTLTPGRLRAKRACSAIAGALEPLVPGGIGRYDEDWSPRAFGDNLTAWGTPVVLVETGGLAGRPPTDLTRLHFVALLTALLDLARDDLAGHDPARYDSLLRTDTGLWADVVLGGGSVLQPRLERPVRADVAFNRLESDRARSDCGDGAAGGSAIVEVGDSRQLGSARRIDVSGAVVTPGFVASVQGPADWLTPAALESLGRLGVGTLRWHVAESEVTRASAEARARARSGAPRIQVESGANPSPLRLVGPPRAPASPLLGDVLEALAGAPGRELARASSPAEIVRRLTSTPEAGPPAIAPGAPATLVVLRGATASDLRLESAWIDGEEQAAAIRATP
jgi:hypothetical protein